MQDVMTLLAALRRPPLLVRAARFGLEDYRRERDLTRVMRLPAAPAPGQAVGPLIEAEAQLEAVRKEGGAGYSIARHVEVLIALMAEARLLPRGPRAV
ncbi:MAG: hypothetical protein CR993_02670 [Rhodobacterales bacterium]|nr:MAG: hypothetical protein CR993_02670 [Rhodobacterales bacterium]